MIYRTMDVAFAAYLCGLGLKVSSIKYIASDGKNGPVVEFIFRQNDADYAGSLVDWKKSEEFRYHQALLQLRTVGPFDRSAGKDIFLTTDLAISAWLATKNVTLYVIQSRGSASRHFGFECSDDVVRDAVLFATSQCALFDARLRTLRKVTSFLREMVFNRVNRCAAI